MFSCGVRGKPKVLGVVVFSAFMMILLIGDFFFFRFGGCVCFVCLLVFSCFGLVLLLVWGFGLVLLLVFGVGLFFFFNRSKFIEVRIS